MARGGCFVSCFGKRRRRKQTNWTVVSLEEFEWIMFAERNRCTTQTVLLWLVTCYAYREEARRWWRWLIFREDFHKKRNWNINETEQEKQTQTHTDTHSCNVTGGNSQEDSTCTSLLHWCEQLWLTSWWYPMNIFSWTGLMYCFSRCNHSFSIPIWLMWMSRVGTFSYPPANRLSLLDPEDHWPKCSISWINSSQKESDTIGNQ